MALKRADVNMRTVDNVDVTEGMLGWIIVGGAYDISSLKKNSYGESETASLPSIQKVEVICVDNVKRTILIRHTGTNVETVIKPEGKRFSLCAGETKATELFFNEINAVIGKQSQSVHKGRQNLIAEEDLLAHLESLRKNLIDRITVCDVMGMVEKCAQTSNGWD